MKKILHVLSALFLVTLMTSQGFGQRHSGVRSNMGGRLRGDARSDQVHNLNAAKHKKHGHKDKDRDNDRDNRNDKDKGKERGESKKH